MPASKWRKVPSASDLVHSVCACACVCGRDRLHRGDEARDSIFYSSSRASDSIDTPSSAHIRLYRPLFYKAKREQNEKKKKSGRERQTRAPTVPSVLVFFFVFRFVSPLFASLGPRHQSPQNGRHRGQVDKGRKEQRERERERKGGFLEGESHRHDDTGGRR